MKKALTVLLAIVFVLALSACTNKKGSSVSNQNQTATSTEQSATQQTLPETTNTSSEQLIGRDRAIELALSHAGLTQQDIHDLEAELDRERASAFWEVDFESGGFEYSYDINAQTEEVFKNEKERD